MKKLLTVAATASLAAVCALSATACNADDTIEVDTNAFFAPFEYYDDSLNIVGVDVEIMKLVGEELGKKVNFTNTEFDVIIDNVASGKQFDCGAAGITITDERKAQVDFSIPYYTSVQYVIYKTGEMTVDGTATGEIPYILWDQLQGKKIGVQRNTTGDIYVDGEMSTGENDAGETTYGALCNPETGEAYAGTELVKYSSAPVAVSALGTAIDVIVVDELPAKYLVKSNSGLACAALYYDADTATEEQYAICVTKGNDELLAAINKVLTELGESGINELVQKHLGLE